MKQLLAATAVLTLALSACQQGSNDNIAIDETNSLNADVETLPPDEGNDATAAANADNQANGAEPAATASIPAAFQGRWGMVPNDCQPGRADAKGLIEIDGTSLKFYEARATLTKVTSNAPENFSGTFAFSGEGQSWSKNETLQLSNSSKTLVRSETDPSMKFTYQRCA